MTVGIVLSLILPLRSVEYPGSKSLGVGVIHSVLYFGEVLEMIHLCTYLFIHTSRLSVIDGVLTFLLLPKPSFPVAAQPGNLGYFSGEIWTMSPLEAE